MAVSIQYLRCLNVSTGPARHATASSPICMIPSSSAAEKNAKTKGAKKKMVATCAKLDFMVLVFARYSCDMLCEVVTW